MRLMGGPLSGTDQEKMTLHFDGNLRTRRFFTVLGDPVPHVESAIYDKDGQFVRRECGCGRVHEEPWS